MQLVVSWMEYGNRKKNHLEARVGVITASASAFASSVLCCPERAKQGSGVTKEPYLLIEDKTMELAIHHSIDPSFHLLVAILCH